MFPVEGADSSCDRMEETVCQNFRPNIHHPGLNSPGSIENRNRLKDLRPSAFKEDVHHGQKQNTIVGREPSLFSGVKAGAWMRADGGMYPARGCGGCASFIPGITIIQRPCSSCPGAAQCRAAEADWQARPAQLLSILQAQEVRLYQDTYIFRAQGQR